MNKESFLLHLYLLENLYIEDCNIRKAWKDFISIIAPSAYAPVFDWKLKTAIDVIYIDNKEIWEWLDYFFYEAKNMKDPIVKDEKWIEYNFSKTSWLIDFLENTWYIHEHNT